MERRDFLKTLVAIPAVAKALALAQEPTAVFPLTGGLEKFEVAFPDGCAFAFSGFVTMADRETLNIVPVGAMDITCTRRKRMRNEELVPVSALATVLHVNGQQVAEIKEITPPSLSMLDSGLIRRESMTFTVDFNPSDVDEDDEEWDA